MTSWCRSCGQVGVQCNRESLLLTAAALTNGPHAMTTRDRCAYWGLASSIGYWFLRAQDC